MQPSTIEIIGTLFFALAVIHTFLAGFFHKLAGKHPQSSLAGNFYHMIGEVEVVFGLWAGLFIIAMILIEGWTTTIGFTEEVHFTEPLFVFAIMTVAASRPIISTAQKTIFFLAGFFRSYRMIAVYFLCLSIGPLLGSFITEPAAMTVIALILYNQFYTQPVSKKFQYMTIAVLFVNVSIGGVLTNYAAPPVLMVSNTWGWTTYFMFHTFGWKAMVATFINATLSTVVCSRELSSLSVTVQKDEAPIPAWITFFHFGFLALIVLLSHHASFCMGVFLFFIGFTMITSRFQEKLKIRQSLLVAFFLAGLVVLGNFQSWWLSPLLERLGEFALFLGSTALTAVTDNAALTYLGSLIVGLPDESKYALVAGAVSGGGLTVIANAPNPAGFSILQKSFGPEGIQPGKLFVYALPPTIVAMICFWWM